MMKRNLWPLGILAVFAVFITGTVVLIVLAASQKEDLVSQNYYEQELRYQSRLDNLERATRAGASVVYDSGARRILVSLPASQITPMLTGSVQFYRPSEAGLDRELPLRPNEAGRQVIDANQLQPGLWKVHVCWSTGGQEYQLDGSLTNSIAAVAPHPSP